MQLALASGRCGLVAPRRPAARRAPKARGPMVRSVLEMNKPASTSNGAGKLDLAGEMADELKYRLAAPKADTDKLYQSGEAFVGDRRTSLPHLGNNTPGPPPPPPVRPLPCPPALPCPQWPGACTTAWWTPLTRPRSTGSERQWAREGRFACARLPVARRPAPGTLCVAVLMQTCMQCMHAGARLPCCVLATRVWQQTVCRQRRAGCTGSEVAGRLADAFCPARKCATAAPPPLLWLTRIAGRRTPSTCTTCLLSS